MDKIYLMKVFVAVGEELSFAGASKRLDISSASVTRAISHLEKSRGVAFFQRENRKLRLTHVGAQYLEDAKKILTMVKNADEQAVGRNIQPNGHLRVTASVAFGRIYVIPGIAEYLRRYPDMDVSAMFVDRNVNLIDEGFDVAIRLGQLPDSGMKAIRVGEVWKGTYASPAYLEKHGTPTHPSDLLQHKIIATEMISSNLTWKFESSTTSFQIKVKPVLSVLNNDSAIDAARLGIGIVRLPSYQAMELMLRGELKEILPEYSGALIPIQLLHQESKFSSTKVRVFIDLLTDRLRAQHFSR